MNIENRIQYLEDQVKALQLVLTGASSLLETDAKIRLCEFISEEYKKTKPSSIRPNDSFQDTLICILEGINEN